MSVAVQHVLRQMQRDPRLAWLIGPGSESFDLLSLEAAAVTGRDVAGWREEFEATLKYERWPSEQQTGGAT